jgi:hypothetical protein
MPEKAKAIARARLNGRLVWVDIRLACHDYLLGSSFTPGAIPARPWQRHQGLKS